MALHTLEAEGWQCREGVLTCSRCRRWFPVSGFLLHLLPDALADMELRAEFWGRHRDWLAGLGLDGDAPAAPEAGDFRLQAKQQDYFDRLAGRADKFSYERFMGSPFWRAVDGRLSDRWLPRVKPRTTLLDVGCGNGRTTFNLAGEARVLAFDISARQVRRAVERAHREGVLGQLNFFVADASTFPVKHEAIDYVVMDGVLHHLPDPARALMETARVLRDGGLYFGKENNETPLRPLFEWLQRVRPLWFEQAGPAPVISAGALQEWGTAAGLRIAAVPSVFLPPHVFGRMTEAWAAKLLDVTDRWALRAPVVRGWGGLLVIEGVKAARQAA